MKTYQKIIVYGALMASPFLASLSKAQPMAEARMGRVENTKIKRAVIRDSRITWTNHYDLSGKLISPKTTIAFGKDSSHLAIENYQIIGSISREVVPLAIDSTQTGASLEIRTHLVYVATAVNEGNISAVIDSVKENVVRSGGMKITQATIMDYGSINFSDSLHYWMVKTFTTIGQDGKALGNSDVVGMGKPFSISYALPGQPDRLKELTAVAAPFPISRQREYDSTNTWIGYKEIKISFALGRYAPGTPPTIITPVKAGFEATEVTAVPTWNAPSSISMQAYPNPARAGQPVNFSVRLTKESNLNVELFDVLGKKVATLASGQYPEGSHNFTFGNGLPPGFYPIKAEAGGEIRTMKIIVAQ